MEIARLLDEMCADGSMVTASVEHGDSLFLSSRLLRVEPLEGRVLLQCSDEKHANDALLKEGSMVLRCNHRGTHYEFACARPREAQHGGVPAIEVDFPDALVAVQRRGWGRMAVPASLPLRCELQVGALVLEAAVTDVSLAGMGVLVYDPGIRLDVGMTIRGARIRHPRLAPLVVDLEVRHVARIDLPDGRAANRAGCRIASRAEDLEDLVRLFVTPE